MTDDPAKYGLKRCGPGALVRVPARLKAMEWEKLLSKWLQLLKAVEDPAEEDKRLKEVGWWYGERALTGLLAAAAWRFNSKNQWWALEEFTSERTGRRITGKAKPNRKSGRGDLWLGLECGNGEELQCGFTIEAKQTSTGRSKEQAVASIEGNLLSAKSQLRRVEKLYRYGSPVAPCYYWPHTSTTCRTTSSKLRGSFRATTRWWRYVGVTTIEPRNRNRIRGSIRA